MLAKRTRAKIDVTRRRSIKSDNSLSLPLVTAEAVTEFIQESLKLGRLEWMKRLREWAQQQKGTR